MAKTQAAMRRCGFMAAAVGSLALALPGAPALAQSDSERGYATEAYTPKDFRMPAGEGCEGEVARWEAVQQNDYASGNIGLKIYHEIQSEIARADAACKAGRAAEASRLVHESRRRHGYPG